MFLHANKQFKSHSMLVEDYDEGKATKGKNLSKFYSINVSSFYVEAKTLS
jgi:hypothetical protein